LAKSELGQPQRQALFSYTGCAGQKHDLRQLPAGHCLGQATAYALMPDQWGECHWIEGKQAMGKH
jgi:hypothetical protein